jgi:glycosyltransferase involved in cell wall biosynthesis
MQPDGSKRRILVLCPYPHGTAASQRFRFEQYLELLRADGFRVDQASFWDEATWKILHAPGHLPRKITGIASGVGRRLLTLAGAYRYDYVFIHLEAAPLGPPIIEALLWLMRRKIIYDIDDAIFMSPAGEQDKSLLKLLKWRSKVAFTTKRAYKVLAVNQHLAEWAQRFNPRVSLIPTTIDPDYHRPAAVAPPKNGRPVIGWTGTFSTAPYLDVVRGALERLQRSHSFKLRAICNRDPGFTNLDAYEFVPWKEATEIEDLQQFDIGIMPVPDTPWALGKVGFKAIQYSAVGVPPVASDVGSARDVIDDGRTGLLVPNTEEAWISALSRLLDDETLRIRLGRAARERVLRTYAIPAQRDNYRALFS